MDLEAAKRATLGALFVTILSLLLGGSVLAACGGNGNSGAGNGGSAATAGTGGTSSTSGGTGGTASTSTNTGASGGGGTGGDSGCVPADCSDGFSCTVDVCGPNSACSHSIGANEGATACPPGQYCTLESGCVAAPACATDAQCKEIWKNDACKTEVACEAASSVCIFKPLDKDGDGHSPPVCGGDDCDDNNGFKHPGKTDWCDGTDDNCNGLVDDGDTCPGIAVCTNGTCVCPAGVTCCDAEVDCLGIGTGYDVAECQAGVCVCKAQYQCGQDCTNMISDNNHCGSCANACPAGAFCQVDTCMCVGGGVACNGGCVDTMTDAQNCGSCGAVCSAGFSCVGGNCTCNGQLCNGVCKNTSLDHDNCGMCGHVCGALEFCDLGICAPEGGGGGSGGGG